MYRLARALDLIDYRCRYPEYLFQREDFVSREGEHPKVVSLMSHYTIKQVGSFFVAHYLKKLGTGRILEVGGGFNQYFSRRFGKQFDYWMVDQPGFYDPDHFEIGRAMRPPHTFVEGLVGDHSPDLPEKHFDVALSVSVLEHVDFKDIRKTAEDMFRITKPGGISLHSIDVTPETTLSRGQEWLDCLTRAGFVDGDVDLDWTFRPGSYEEEILLEPLESAYESFGSVEARTAARKFEQPVIRPYHYSTILAHCTRPE